MVLEIPTRRNSKENFMDKYNPLFHLAITMYWVYQTAISQKLYLCYNFRKKNVDNKSDIEKSIKIILHFQILPLGGELLNTNLNMRLLHEINSDGM